MWTRGLTLLLVMLTALPLGAQTLTTTSREDVWKTFTSSLEPGAFVVVKTRDGRRMKGTFVDRATDGIVMQEKTRIPVPPREVSFADITAIERAKPGWSPGLKVVAGVGIGAAVALLTSALIFAAVGYD